jgi:hypothetical protein
MKMSVKPRRSVMGRCDDLVFIYAALFLICALLNALGGGVIGLLVFVPAALAVTLFVSGKPQPRIRL